MNADACGFDRSGWELTGRVLGVFYSVYNELGSGFLESVYQAAMVLALEQANLPLTVQVPLEVLFRGQRVGTFRADLVVGDSVLVELKAAQAIDDSHIAQLLNYLKATSLEIGLLLNFGPRPQFRRLVYSNLRKGPGVRPNGGA